MGMSFMQAFNAAESGKSIRRQAWEGMYARVKKPDFCFKDIKYV